MTDAYGPIWAAGFENVTESGYKLLYLPDLHNDQLQREGKAPVYWWLPNDVRLATRDNGDFAFSFMHFEGVRTESANVGVEGESEVAGGLLTFSTTTSPPAEVLRESEDEILDRCRGRDDRFWGWHTNVAPMFRPAPIVSNVTMVSNLSPNADGSVPAVQQPPAGTPGPAGGAPGGPAGGAPAGPPGGAPAGAPPHRSLRQMSRPPVIRSRAVPAAFRSPRTVRLGHTPRGLDQWYFHLQGQGPGSVSPFAQNAYSALVGSLPAAMIWASFHGGSSAISVWQYMKIRVWSPAVHLHIEGDWDRIQDHFSAAAHAGGWFWSADVQAQFNDLRMSGGIEVTVEVDTTLPNAKELQEAIEKRSDLVFQKFMDEAQKVIFEPPPFQEKPAEASGGFLGWGGGGAVKMRRDHSHLHLTYDEHREVAYLQDYPVSGQMEGMYDVIKADPTAEKKYFTTIYLGDWERKLHRVFKPVVNWPDPAQKWIGQPVAFVSAQVGYPNTQGAIQWDGKMFQGSDPADVSWRWEQEMKSAADVTNPPPGWTPDKTFIRRQVHFTEPPNETENPFVRVSIEKNEVDLDPGEFGRLIDDINLEVRAENVGGLNVGPMILGVNLETAQQLVEVTFQVDGKTEAGTPRAPVRFTWQFADQEHPRYWMVFTGQPDFVPSFTYQVRVIVKGSIFTKGQEWIGPKVQASGSGPLTLSVPTPDDPGVEKRSIPGWLVSMPTRSGGRPRLGRAAPKAAPPAAAPRRRRAPKVAPAPATVRDWPVEEERELTRTGVVSSNGGDG
jgi:hypothetical protein